MNYTMSSRRLDVITIGECLVEIMRDKRDVPHSVPGTYLGPYPSGAPAIFADACARLGLKVGIIGAVGKDDFGKLLLDRLKGDGVDVSKMKVLEDNTTGVAFVTYFSSGSRQFIFHIKHAAAGQIFPEDVDPDYVRGSRLLHLMGSSLSINENCREACYKAVEIAKSHGGVITFDPNLRPELLDISTIRRICRPVLEVAKVVLPSGVEAEALTGSSDPIEAGKKLLEYGPKIAVIKLGEKGSIAVTRDDVVEMPAIKVKEVDPTGAGDVYDAAFVYGLLNNWPVEKILKFANAAGAIKVTRFGPMEGPVSRREIEEFLEEHGESL
ncbi:MAG TPA: sugar kinase [Nitrososphaeria archaeon]|nr:sugar kinase [Nitrososphaeria archaeon]